MYKCFDNYYRIFFIIVENKQHTYIKMGRGRLLAVYTNESRQRGSCTYASTLSRLSLKDHFELSNNNILLLPSKQDDEKDRIHVEKQYCF